MSTRKDDDKTRLVGKGISPQDEATIIAGAAGNPPSGQSTPTNTRKLINNRFQLETLLGSGGMGSVYKAIDQRKVEARDRDPYVALKLLNEDFKQHPDAFISLQRESRKSQNLAHPNIVTVYDFDRDGDMVFMTMEYMEGHPLDELIKRQAGIGFEDDQAVNILRDISRAMGHAHSKNIIHSDFKPGNIFVTHKGTAKVFDFGIARAVSASGVEGTPEGDKTVFDAGSLSALTPAYASYEMLKGEEPSTSDDVYALACVAYELFAGKHPFNKTPADKAFEQQLKPEKIKRLSQRQWKALEQALAFKRDQRTQTVPDFEKAFFCQSKLPVYGAVASLILATVAAFIYQYTTQEAEQEVLRETLTEELQVDLRANIELEMQQKSALEALNKALEQPPGDALNGAFDSTLNQLIGRYQALVPEDNDSIVHARQRAMGIYLQAAAEATQTGRLDDAEAFLKKAADWRTDASEYSRESSLLANAREEVERERQRQRLAAEEEARQQAEALRLQQEKLAQEKRERDARLARDEALRQKALAEEKRQQQIKAAIASVNNNLTCNSKLDINGKLAASLNHLETLSPSDHNTLTRTTIDSLTSCIRRAGVKNPKTAARFQSDALTLFPDATSIQSIKIDFCAHLAPGSGKKGQRYYCQDKLASGGNSPTLVVGRSEQEKLAVTRYEITVGDFNQYCRQTGQCTTLKAEADLPAHNITIDQANGYARWLSQETGYHYRLPSHKEWLSLTSPQSNGSDPDRNCYLKFGNLHKGLSLVKAATGKQNDNGLINHVGNVQEWVFDSNGELVAAGGSRKDPLKRCLVTTRSKHSGQPDEYTGFRLIRTVL
ncbi:protein kinase domain-containing protein [Endozoicomonas lisbonensis]|uniref:Serine/threonine protein kinase n=1 Tax=Endozoicomonas lisbonensis TaxID=3120522 RepID=A0ABV2SD27_9GAMM